MSVEMCRQPGYPALFSFRNLLDPHCTPGLKPIHSRLVKQIPATADLIMAGRHEWRRSCVSVGSATGCVSSADNRDCASTMLAHPTRFERVAFAFGGRRSIQLSYGCLLLTQCLRGFRV